MGRWTPSVGTVADGEHWDVVVVGAGSAGCALAARLSADPGLRVLVLEAGRRDRLGITRLPAALLRTIGNPRYDWAYTSEPDPTRGGQSELWPRGRTRTASFVATMIRFSTPTAATTGPSLRIKQPSVSI